MPTTGPGTFLRIATATAVVLVLAVVGGPHPAARAAPAASPADALAARVDGASVRRHLAEFQRIADTSGGTRGYDQVGFDRSVRYVTDRLTEAGYRVRTQRVPYTDFAVTRERLTVAGRAPRDVPVLMTRFTPSTGAGGLTAPLVSIGTRTGCTAADYGTAARGAVVVLGRAACGYSVQQQAAADAGARAMLLWYPVPTPANNYRLIAFTPPAFAIPVASVSQSDGEVLARQAAAGRVTVRLTLRATATPRTTTNVFAETPTGDPDSVVMVGGHLDSVTEGPGINDNATTAATVLQTALAMAHLRTPVAHKVRFAWWGAEELVNIGSTYYVDHLSGADRQRIRALVNGELLASPNFGRFVWGSPGAQGFAGDLFARYFDRRGIPYERVSPDSIGSDHLAFTAVGIPVGGVDGGTLGVKTAAQQARFGGVAGQMFDACYHQPCDRLGNLSTRALDENAPAYAWVVGALAADPAGTGRP